MFKILILFFFLDGSPYAKIDLSRLKVMADLLWKATSWNRFLVANSNSSFYYGWSLSLSVYHVTLKIRMRQLLTRVHSQLEVFRPCCFYQFQSG